MFRMTCVAGALLLVSSSLCFAGDFYVGGGLGPEFADFRQDSTVQSKGGVAGTFYVKNQSHLAAKGIFGTVFAGYGEVFSTERQDFYLAGEVNFNLSTANLTSYNKEFINMTFSKSDYRVQRSLGISLLPGILLTDTTLLYGRVGFSEGKFRVATTDPSLRKSSKYYNGFRYGFGLGQGVTEDWAIRVEYSDVAYRNVEMLTRDPISAVTKGTTISPQTSQTEFSLVYSF